MTFEAVVKMYEKQMLGVAERIVKNRHDAEDAVQTALLRISKIKLPQNESSLRAYVLTAAKHAALDLLPKQCHDVDLDDVILPCSEDLFETVAASQDYERLLSAIKALPEKYRNVLMLRYVQELETKEISLLLGRPLATVQKQITRAKALLVQIYNKNPSL